MFFEEVVNGKKLYWVEFEISGKICQYEFMEQRLKICCKVRFFNIIVCRRVIAVFYNVSLILELEGY